MYTKKYIKTQKIEEKCTHKNFFIKHIKNAKKYKKCTQTKKNKKCTQTLQKSHKMPKMKYRG
jgi:hypothetical protein